ncbi:MAG: hypothetical protein AAB071_06110, partial [Bacteroidota bacterium]
ITGTADLLDEDRQALYKEYDGIADILKKEHDAEWEEKRKNSEQIKATIVSEINTLSAEYERLCNEESDKVRDKLLQTENALRKLKDLFKGGQMVKEDHDNAWYLYQETWDKVNQRKKFESYSNREKFLADAEKIREALAAKGIGVARDMLREIQKVRNGFFFIHDDFRKLQLVFDEIYAEINNHAKQQQSEFFTFLERRIANGKEFLLRAKSRVEKVQMNIAKNQERMSGTLSDEFRQKVEAWMKEDTTDLDKLTKKISKVEKEIEISEKKMLQKNRTSGTEEKNKSEETNSPPDETTNE